MIIYTYQKKPISTLRLEKLSKPNFEILGLICYHNVYFCSRIGSTRAYFFAVILMTTYKVLMKLTTIEISISK